MLQRCHFQKLLSLMPQLKRKLAEFHSLRSSQTELLRMAKADSIQRRQHERRAAELEGAHERRAEYERDRSAVVLQKHWRGKCGRRVAKAAREGRGEVM